MKSVWLARVTTILVVVGLNQGPLRPALAADPAPATQFRRQQASSLELHWGFVHTLGPASGEPTLLLPFDGQVSISDGDDTTTEGVHLISALLFESGGSYEEGRDDSVTQPREQCWPVGNAGLYCPWISWRSATTNDWDGIALTFRWAPGTDPVVRVETSQGTWEMPASQLPQSVESRELGPQGQELESGPFFTLAYRVYDLLLQWGYDRAEDRNPTGQPMLVPWDGSLTLSAGGIRLLNAQRFESGGPYEEGRDDQVLERDDLSRVVAWRSSTLDPRRRAKEADGLALNFVVPQGERASVVLEMATGGQREFVLPARFRDVHQEWMVDEEGHGVHAHLHWCWFKDR